MDGRKLDLPKIFTAVAKRGGYAAVTLNRCTSCCHTKEVSYMRIAKPIIISVGLVICCH